MYSRTKLEPGSVTAVTWVSNDTTSAQVPANSFEVPYNLTMPSYESQFERISPPVIGPRTSWKNFCHYRVVQVSKPMGQKVRYPTPTGYYPYSWAYLDIEDPLFGALRSIFGSTGSYNSQLPGFYDSESEDAFVLAPSDIGNLKQKSLRTMLPLIKSELSVVNSVIELRDFESLPRTLRSIFSPTEFAFNFAGSIGKTLRRLTRTASDGYLQYKFNLAPLLSDICGIAAAAHRTLKRMNELVSRSGRTQSKHFRFDFVEYPDTTDEGTWGVNSDPVILDRTIFSSFVGRRKVFNDLTSFHAQIEYNYNYTRYQIEHAQLLTFLDGIGLNLNPAIIWNAIPWSFVVDWVIGIGRWLDNRKRLNMEPKINIHRYLWSVRRSRDIDVAYKVIRHGDFFQGWEGQPGNSQALHGDLGDQVVQLPRVRETAYRRVVELPDSNSFTTSGLNSTEFSLGAALVLSRRSKPKRNH